MASIVVEAAVVGASLAFALAACHALGWWPTSALGVAWLGFVVGAAFHLLFEAFGWNAHYCIHGAACKK